MVPWELRLLVIRLQGVAYGDLKRSIVGYYDLARDVRMEITKAKSKEEGKAWRERLRECGVCVGNCLVDMRDLSGAKRHFQDLRRVGDKGWSTVLDGRLALVCLKMGDVEGARRVLAAGEDEADGKDVVMPLLSMAEGRFEDAVEEWRALQGGPHGTIATQNLAVCLLYTGKLDEVSSFGSSSFASPCQLPLFLFPWPGTRWRYFPGLLAHRSDLGRAQDCRVHSSSFFCSLPKSGTLPSHYDLCQKLK